jgi:hypothetical protein
MRSVAARFHTHATSLRFAYLRARKQRARADNSIIFARIALKMNGAIALASIAAAHAQTPILVLDRRAVAVGRVA